MKERLQLQYVLCKQTTENKFSRFKNLNLFLNHFFYFLIILYKWVIRIFCLEEANVLTNL